MYEIKYTNQFKKSVKRCKKRGFKLDNLVKVVDLLQNNGQLPKKYKPHKLTGNYSNCWECHIKPDWLLIWLQDDNTLTLLFIDTGTHSDLF